MKFMNVDKKVKKNWVIRRIIALIIFIFFLVMDIVFTPKDIYGLWLSSVIFLGIIVFIQIAFTVIFPIFQYNRYLYMIKEDEIIIMQGVIFRKSFVIPAVQIQDIGYTQGPVQLLMNLSTIQISTAGSNHSIDGINKDEAAKIVEEIKEKIKKIASKIIDGGSNEVQ